MTQGIFSSVFCLVICFISSLGSAQAAWTNGYTYRRQITINHSQVTADQSNFPVVIAGIYSDLASASNGGHVTSAFGYDLLVTADSNGSQPLNFERVSWSATSGSIVMIVNLPVLSATTDTSLYLFYGNSTVTSDPQNRSGVWDSSFKGVFHLNENSADTVVANSMVAANPGVSAKATATRSVVGPFAGGTTGGGLSFQDPTDSVDLGVSADWDVTTGDATWEFWIKPIRLDTYSQIISHGSYGADGYYFQWTNQAVNPAGVIAFNSVVGVPVAVVPPVSVGTWSHLTFVKSGTTGRWYVNGSPSSSGYFGNLTSSARHLWLGRSDSNDSNAAVVLSEFRFSNTARSADWIATTYANENNPATFYTFGSAQTRLAITDTSSFVIF